MAEQFLTNITCFFFKLKYPFAIRHHTFLEYKSFLKTYLFALILGGSLAWQQIDLYIYWLSFYFLF